MLYIASTVLAMVALLDAAETPHQTPQQLFSGGTDLAQYISRPELRNPILNVTRLEPEALTPGYWFMAPYADLEAASLGKEYVPFQAGPHIYDNQGELIWSGAKMVENRNAYDLRLVKIDSGLALSYMIDREREITDNPGAAGVVMDMSYQILHTVYTSEPADGFPQVGFDMHEFNVFGNSSLSIWQKRLGIDLTDLEGLGVNLSAIGAPEKTGSVIMKGFREIDINTNKITLDWWPLKHGLSINESMAKLPTNWEDASWDFIHTNSVDKNEAGDYLVSMRHTSALYKISHIDGSIMWRLGGKISDFQQNFNFSSQHDAKFVSQNDTVTIISVFDNGADDRGRQATTAFASSMKVVALYEKETPKRAMLLKEFVRPDGRLTNKRGQAQVLANGGGFVSWSDQGYISEHTPDGRPVMEALFVSKRFANYRAYKYDYVGMPTEPPTLKTVAFGSGSLSSLSSVFAVSWNGATEVAHWNFYGSNDVSKGFEQVGSIKRSGFETTYIDPGFWAFSYAEALFANGTTLGKSVIGEIVLPNGHSRNITDVGLTMFRTPAEDRHTSIFSILAIVFVGLLATTAISALLISRSKQVSPLRWRRQAYSRVQDDEKAAEDGELNELKDSNDSDDESDDRHAAESSKGGL